jgi:multidrug resistance protein, MATE family
MKTTDTALLGHVSREALSAAALSDLWTMCTAVLVQGSVLGILVGGAVGSNNPKLAGIYLQVSYLVLGFVGIAVFLSWNLTEWVWTTFGSDPEISKMAGYYAKVLALSLPAQILYSQLSQFFSAQRIMHPEVNASTMSMILNLLIGLVFVLGVGVPNFSGFGFKACPIVTTIVVYFQVLTMWYVYIYRQRLHETCWGGWSMKEITWARIKTFSSLYFPSAFGLASDFWRVAVIGAVAADLGEEEVAVFNTSYRIMWIVMILVMALSSASAINMSQRLGKLDHNGARQAGYLGVSMAAVVCFVITVFVWSHSRVFGKIFTTDEVFLQMFEEVRTPFSITLFLMNMSVAIEKIPYSMGRTIEVFWLGLIASWGGKSSSQGRCGRTMMIAYFSLEVKVLTLICCSASTWSYSVYKVLEERFVWLVHWNGDWLRSHCCTVQCHYAYI